MRARFGLSLSTRAILFDWGSMDDILDMAVTAEESGLFDGIWVGDNLLSKPRVESIVTLSAMATRTQRVKLGTVCVASFPLREPLLFALQWASLDVLSKGRTILTVCNGGSRLDGERFAHELEVMGVKSAERPARVVEGITILRKLWDDGLASHSGQFRSFSDVDLQPKPIQKPMPIHIAINPKREDMPEQAMERILQRVARHGDGWQTDGTPVAVFKQRFDKIRQYVSDFGRDAASFDSSLHMMVNINEDRDKAFEEATAFLGAYYGAGYISRERAETWLAYGSPQAVIDKLAAYIEAGCTMPIIRFVSAQPREQMQRCIEEVLPAFRA